MNIPSASSETATIKVVIRKVNFKERKTKDNFLELFVLIFLSFKLICLDYFRNCLNSF